MSTEIQIVRKIDMPFIPALKTDVGHQSHNTFRPFKVFTVKNIHLIKQLKKLDEDVIQEIKVVASVLPFRVNEYVIEELIDWQQAPDDPIFRLTFPNKTMLPEHLYNSTKNLIFSNLSKSEIAEGIKSIRMQLNPHPSGQMEKNIPVKDGEVFSGIQHKYSETVLFFPSSGQVCHSYCTFCFRWAQFVGDKELKIAAKETVQLQKYLQKNKQVTDVLITGGDPLVMKTKNLRAYIEPLLKPEFSHIKNIRLGTKSLTFWPHRFVTDEDANELLDFLSLVNRSGKQVALMAHYNHWKELDTQIAKSAIKRVQNTGTQIRAQGPVLANINNDAAVWSRLWKSQVSLGIYPYYMFVERDTGAKNYFEIPLAEAYAIYKDAIKGVSGLSRTARGPSMSADPGKVEIQGIAEIHNEKVFVLRFIQARNADWVNRPFFAKYSKTATWLDQLEPAFGEKKFFFEECDRSLQ